MIHGKVIGDCPLCGFPMTEAETLGKDKCGRVAHGLCVSAELLGHDVAAMVAEAKAIVKSQKIFHDGIGVSSVPRAAFSLNCRNDEPQSQISNGNESGKSQISPKSQTPSQEQKGEHRV